MFPQLQDRPAPPETLAGLGLLPHRLAATRRTVRAAARHQLGSGPPRRLQEAGKKGGEDTGPSPVDRRKCGTAIHVASDAYGMPLGAVVSAANVNDGVKTQAVLGALVVKPPPAEVPAARPDPRDLPRSRADGGLWQPPEHGAGGCGRLSDGGAKARPGPAARSRYDPLCGGALPCVPVPVRADRAAVGP